MRSKHCDFGLSTNRRTSRRRVFVVIQLQWHNGSHALAQDRNTAFTKCSQVRYDVDTRTDYMDVNTTTIQCTYTTRFDS